MVDVTSPLHPFLGLPAQFFAHGEDVQCKVARQSHLTHILFLQTILECWFVRVTCKELSHLVPHVVLFNFERASKLCEHGRVLIPFELLLTGVTASSLKRVRELCANWQLNVPFNTNPRDPPLILTDMKFCFAGLCARLPADRQASVSQSPSSTLRALVQCCRRGTWIRSEERWMCGTREHWWYCRGV